MNDKKYVPKHLKDASDEHYERLDENPVDLDWLNKFIDECQSEDTKKGDTEWVSIFTE